MATRSTTTTIQGSFGGDVPVETGEEEALKLLEQIPELVEKTYAGLVQSGRETDAFALRDSFDRFSRSASGLGINSFARSSALTDLRNRMNVAARSREANLKSSEIDKISNALGAMANLRTDSARTRFAQNMANAERKGKFSTTTSMSGDRGVGVAAKRRLPAPARAAAPARSLTTTRGRDADSRMNADIRAREQFYIGQQRADGTLNRRGSISPYVLAQQDVRKLWQTGSGTRAADVPVQIAGNAQAQLQPQPQEQPATGPQGLTTATGPQPQPSIGPQPQPSIGTKGLSGNQALRPYRPAGGAIGIGPSSLAASGQVTPLPPMQGTPGMKPFAFTSPYTTARFMRDPRTGKMVLSAKGNRNLTTGRSI